MNPKHLFTLTAHQREKYQTQPDSLPDYDWYENYDEYEQPPYMKQSTLRFWYNTQTVSYSRHWHNAHEMIVPLEEGYRVTIQSESWDLKPGDIFLIPPGELHSLEAPDSGARFIFLYELDFLSQPGFLSLTRSFLTKPVLISSASCSSIYEKEISLVMQLASHYWAESPVRLLHIYSCLLEFFACYTEFCCTDLSASHPGPASGSSVRKLNEALSYMEQNYAGKLSLEDTARIAGFSKFYFTRIFKQYTGQTFYEYLNTLRIQASEELLLDTGLSVSQIAKACGYQSVSSFNRSFRTFRHCSPSEFRRLHGHGMP